MVDKVPSVSGARVFRALPGRVRALPREILLVASGVVAYFGVRGLTEADPATAERHANDVVAFERAVGLFHEPALQDLAADSHTVITLMNWVYIWGHWPVIVATLLWLTLRHPTVFRRTRNAMVVSGAAGLVVFVTFPVAPPRLAGLDLVDTVTLHSRAYRVLQPPAFVNQYAAVPSLHVGWDLLMGVAMVTASSRLLLRVVGCVLPLLMAAAVVITANHYLVDVLAGGVLALAGLALALGLERRTRHGGRSGGSDRRQGRPSWDDVAVPHQAGPTPSALQPPDPDATKPGQRAS